MISKEDINGIEKTKNALSNALVSFNENVKRYLRDGLQTEGEEEVVDKVRLHLGIYLDLEKNPLTRYMDLESNKFSAAMVCRDGRSAILDAGKEELKDRKWWNGVLGTDSSKIEWKEQRVNNSFSDGFIGGVELVLVGEINTENMLSREKILLETLLDILSEMLSDIRGIGEIKELLKGREQRGYRKLIEAYAAKVYEHYKKKPILEEKDCIRLSHEKYEGREEPAKIYIGENKRELLEKTKESGEFICWENGWKPKEGVIRDKAEKDRLDKRKIKYYRKMMELCKNNKYLITCFNEKEEINILGAADEDWLVRNEYTIHIDFDGNGEWYIKEGNDEVLCYIKGLYYYSKTGVAHVYQAQLKKEAELEEEMVEKFGQIIECLSEQKHGAGMIVVEDAGEIAREFCSTYNRGTVLDEALDLTDGRNQEFLLGMTSMDGMLLVDKRGRCHAFGVILDGKARIKANPARGSRYNSAVNYIHDKKGSFAVIVSEDETVDIIGKSIWGEQGNGTNG